MSEFRRVSDADMKPKSRGGTERFTTSERSQIRNASQDAMPAGLYGGMAAGGALGASYSRGRDRRIAREMSRSVSRVVGHGRLKTAANQVAVSAKMSKPSLARAVFTTPGTVGMLGGATAGTMYTAGRAKNKKAREIESVKKSVVSAFGIDHG